MSDGTYHDKIIIFVYDNNDYFIMYLLFFKNFIDSIRDTKFYSVLLIKNKLEQKELQILLEKIRKSNEGSFKELFSLYYQRLSRYAYYILNNKEWADEVVQEFFSKIWAHRKKIKINGSISSYMYISVRNASNNLLKSNVQRRIRESNYSAPVKSNDDITFNKEIFTNRLIESLKMLPDQCQEVYCLKNLEGLSYKEIAEYLNISEKTVETHIYKALKRLRELMAKYKNTFYSTE